MLGDEEMNALRTQGFVTAERRGSNLYFKLRFRVHGKQRVRYLGRDATLADRIRQELDAIRAPKRILQNMHRVDQHARRLLRQMKSELSPILAVHGYRFHGMAIRKARRDELAETRKERTQTERDQ